MAQADPFKLESRALAILERGNILTAVPGEGSIEGRAQSRT